jgi:PilZ domain
MKERRQAARKRSLLQGRVYYNHRRSSVDCLVRDISERGAKLVFGEPVAVPDVLELYLPGKEELHRVVVQWRKGTEMGVDFGLAGVTDDSESASPSTDLAGRLHKLESELSALKRIVSELRAEIRIPRRCGVTIGQAH